MKRRNAIALAAKQRKAGPHKSKKEIFQLEAEERELYEDTPGYEPDIESDFITGLESDDAWGDEY